MEQLTKHHLKRVRGLSRHAARLLELSQVPPGKGEKAVPLNLEQLRIDLLLINENARMIQAIERLGDEVEEVEQGGATPKVA